MWIWLRESLMREWWRKFCIMVWLLMGLGFGFVVAGGVSGEYAIQCSGFLERGFFDMYGEWRHSRNACV